MNSALIKLYKLRAWGAIRQLLRSARTVRGAAALLVAGGLLALIIVPGVVGILVAKDSKSIIDTQLKYDVMCLGLLVFGTFSITTSAGERAVHFSPSEIDFLFPAPLSRRALLIYKIVETCMAGVFIALIVSTSLSMFLDKWTAAFIGLLLAILGIHALTICVQMIGLIIGEYAYKRSQRVFLGLIAALLAFAFVQVGMQAFAGSWTDVLHRFRESTGARIALMPPRLFANIVFAPGVFPELLGWSAVGIAVVVMMYALAVVLDANYLETAVHVSRRVQERIDRASRSGGIDLSRAIAKRRNWMTRLPRFPRLNGAGPIARRQTILCLASLRGAFLLLLMVGLGMGVPILIGLRGAKNVATIAPQFAIGAFAYITFLFSSQVGLSFRGDLEQMPLFKSLPIPARAIVLGEILPSSILLAILQCFVFLPIAVAIPGSWQTLAVGCVFVLPYNVLIFGIDGLLFLLYPVRFAQGARGVLVAGKHVITLFVKFLILLVAVLCIAIPGAILFYVTRSWILLLAVSWFVCWIPSGVLIFLTGWAFERFDVSEHVE